MSKGVIPQLPELYPKKGEVYEHYKGDSYEVIELAIHSNEGIWMGLSTNHFMKMLMRSFLRDRYLSGTKM